jgi:acyl-CoA thioesterase
MEVTPTHPFDRALAFEPLGAGRWRAHTSADYANMIGPFGGTTAAAALAAAWGHPERQGEPIALTVNYAGPIADGAYELEAEVVRTNRSTQHWRMQLVQQGAAVATAPAVFASRRQTWSSLEAGFPAVPAAAELPRMAPIERVRWTHSYDMRFVKGQQFVQPPPTDADSVSLLWVRDQPPRPLDFPSLAALCDVFFPRIFLRRASWVPIGTVSFTVYFHADSQTLARVGDAHLLGHARSHQFRNGYFDQSAEMWGPGGELLAVTHQMVYFKE